VAHVNIVQPLAAAALLALTACASSLFDDPSTLYVSFICNPQGSTIYQDGVNMGSCPTTLQYNLTDEDKANGYKLLKRLTTFWVSGASTTTPEITAYLKNGLRQEYHIERPRNVPNHDTDANYALNLEKNQILREQVAAAQNQSASITVESQAAAPRHCTTNRIGQTSYTNCY